MPQMVYKRRMHRYRSFAVGVLAIADLVDPATSNHDPVPRIFDVSPLQTEGFADAQPRRCDKQCENKLRLLQLVEKHQGLFRNAGDRLIIRGCITVDVSK